MSQFATLRTQTGDAYLHLDFEKDLTFVKNLGQGAFGTVDWCVGFQPVPREASYKALTRSRFDCSHYLDGMSLHRLSELAGLLMLPHVA